MNGRTIHRGNPVRAIVRMSLVALVGVCVLLGSQPQASFAADAKTKAHAVALRERPDRSLASLNEAVGKHLLDADVLKALKRKGSVEALVVFDGSSVRRTADIEAGKGKDRKKKVQAGLRTGHKAQKAKVLKGVKGVTVVDAFDGVSIANVRFSSAAGLLKVLDRGSVLGVQLSETHAAQLDQSLGLIRQPSEVNSYGFTGSGTTIAILDTGVNYSSGYFGTCPQPGASGCRIIEAVDFRTSDGVQDDNGHGTNVAGIAAAVAPGARLLAYDVFTGSGTSWGAQDKDVVDAITRAIALQATYNVRAINLSIGSPGPRWTSDCASRTDGNVNLYTQAFADARLAGIVPVVSAGNDARPGNAPFTAGLAFPACTAGAVRVGAVYDSSFGSIAFKSGCSDSTTAQDKITCFSQSGPNLTVLAPGSQILAAGITQSGTSQAAPHVAGAVAVLASARPGASIDAIISSIANTGPQIADARPGAGQKRRLDLYAAVAAIRADVTKPVFTANPSSGIDPSYLVETNGLTPVKFAWHATDSSGIARYYISIRANGGTWEDLNALLKPKTAESISLDLTPGLSYEFAVSALDHYGNQSDWRYSNPVTVGLAAENGTGVSFGGSGWTRTAWNSAVGGYLTYGATTNAYVRYTIPANTARTVGWVGTSDTNRGQAKVYLDGTPVATIELSSQSTVARKIQYLTAIDPSRVHYLDVQIVGTAGRPTVDVDAFVTLR